jgi:hypothetical protein
MSIRDEYNELSFQKGGNKFSDSLKRYKSETHREFFESKLNSSCASTGIDKLIDSTLSKLQVKLKHEIEGGANQVSPSPSNLKGVNKKLQLTMAAKETQNTLDVIRAKE